MKGFPERVAVRDASPVPIGPGVYLLILDDAVQYVGVSRSPLRRIATHAKRGRIDFDRYWVHECSSRQQALDLERRMIRRLDPPCNVQHKPKTTVAESDPLESAHTACREEVVEFDGERGVVAFRFRDDLTCLAAWLANKHGMQTVADALGDSLTALIERYLPGSTAWEPIDDQEAA